MPGRERRRRSGQFDGGLLSVPQAIPDDDEDAPAEEEPAPAAEVDLAPAPVEPEPAPARPAPREELRRPPARPVRKPRPRREQAPTSIRLYDRAADRLWETFLEARKADPQLSYVEWCSAVVEQGLDRRRR